MVKVFGGDRIVYLNSQGDLGNSVPVRVDNVEARGSHVLVNEVPGVFAAVRKHQNTLVLKLIGDGI